MRINLSGFTSCIGLAAWSNPKDMLAIPELFFYSSVMEKQVIKTECIIEGDCTNILQSFPSNSIDLIFADPPYNLQLNQELWRPNQTLVNGVKDEWDHFPDLSSYDQFSIAWLTQCRRILKEDGTIWVIGSYHNIFRIGYIMQNLGFWFLNDVLWVKTNPMPNFRGVRFTNAHETLIWACRQQKSKYKFNYHAMKNLNGGLQMRSDWNIPICTGSERLRIGGKKAHSTQKPEALLYRVISSSSNPGDTILDPFFGTGTTGVVAKKLHRHWIGIEKERRYIKIAQERLDAVEIDKFDPEIYEIRSDKRRRVPFGKLIESGMLIPGQSLYFNQEKSISGVIRADGTVKIDQFVGSIHQAAKYLMDGKPANGWQHWHFENQDGDLKPIDELRSEYLRQSEQVEGD